MKNVVECTASPESPVAMNSPLLLPAPEHPTPANGQPATSPPFRRARRNGKIARLPRKLRDLINELLCDGLAYADIIQRLNESTDPPLPYEITQKNLSNWHTGGFQDWERHQERMELMCAKLDFALDLAQNSQPEKLQELSLQLAAMRLCEFLSELAIADPQTDPTLYLRLLSALPRISREALNLQKYRDAAAQAQAQKLPPAQTASDQDLADSRRTALLDRMDDVWGLKSYRNLPPAAALRSDAPQPGARCSDASHSSHPSDLHTPALPRPDAPQLDASHPSDLHTPTPPGPAAPPTDTVGHLQTPTPTPPPKSAERCRQCRKPLPPLLPSGEPPLQHCDHCGSPIPLTSPPS